MKNRVITILTITLIIFYALIPAKVYAEETADVGGVVIPASASKNPVVTDDDGNILFDENGQKVDSDIGDTEANGMGSAAEIPSTSEQKKQEEEKAKENQNNNENSNKKTESSSKDDSKDSGNSNDSDFTYQNFSDVEKEGLQNYQSIINQGSAAVNGKQVDIKEISGEGSTIIKTLVRLLCLIPQSAQLMLSVFITPYMEVGSRRRF